jgi:poly(A) polymerase
LNNKLLRAIGEPEHRFEEDHLRMLRAVRFAARFGLQIEPATVAAIASHATHLARISPERVAEELRLMLTATTRATAAQLAREFGLDDVIFRFTPAPRLRAQRPMVMFDRVEPGTRISFGFALAAASIEYRVQRMPHLSEWPAMIRDFNIRGMVQGLRQSLRISNEEADEMEETLYGLNFLLTEEKPAVAALKRFLARPTAPLSRKLLAALSVENARELDDRLRALEQTDIAPQPLITGDDLTAAGLAPGPVFKRVLDAVYDAQLEDRIASKDQAMELAMRLARC